jgi:hypothetical protein
MNHTSKSEQDIDRVLTALRDAQPTSGMESRILQAIEHRISTSSRWTPWMQWSIAALATAAIILAIALTTHNNQPTTANIAQSLLPAPTPNLSSQQKLAPFAPANLSSRPKSALFADVVERPAVPSAGQPTTADSARDRLAMEETQAPSHPAPPLPLTSDERLLLRAAQRSEPVQIAQLEPLAVTPKQATAPEEDEAFKQAVQHFLKQVAAAETLNPTTPDANPSENPPN